MVSHYLATIFEGDPSPLSDIKISELLELFIKETDNITVLDLYKHVCQKYREGESSFSAKLTTETDKFSDTLLIDVSDKAKPFCSYGEVTLNQIGVSLKENLNYVNWDFVYNQTNLQYMVYQWLCMP